jgi:hypothetical protein
MKSVGKLNGETHFEDRDEVYDMGREEAQFLELTNVLRITQLRHVHAHQAKCCLKKICCQNVHMYK